MNNRDVATLIIIFLLLLFLLFRGAGSSLLGMLKLLFSHVAIIILTPYAGYSILLIFGASRMSIWKSGMLKDTVLTVSLIGLPMVFRAIGVRSGGLLFRQTMRETLGLSALVAFYINLESLSVIWEFVLQVTILIVGLLSVVARAQLSAEIGLIRALDRIMVLIGLAYLSFTTLSLIHHRSTFDLGVALRTFAFSIWFPVLLIPYMYIFSFLLHCSSVFAMLPFGNGGEKPNLRVRFALFLGLRFSIRHAAAFDGKWRSEIGSLQSFREASRAMDRFRTELPMEI